MGFYGRYTTSGDADYGITPASQQRAAVYNMLGEDGWAHTVHAWLGKVSGGDANASVRLAAWRVSSMNPAERLFYSSPITVTSVGSTGGTTTKYSASVANVASAYSPGSNAIKIHAGQRYSLGFATNNQVGHSMIQASSIPSADNKNFYYKNSTTTPATPNGYTSSSNEGHISIYLEYTKNRIPVAGAVEPTGTISSSTPVFEGSFTDADSIYGDQITLYRIQVYRVSDNELMWDSGSKVPTPTQQSNDNFLLTYQGSSLTSGVDYRWRCRVADDFGTWSNWSSYTTFQINDGGVTLPSNPIGKQTTNNPTPFTAGWVHANDLSTTHVQVRILQGSTPILTSGEIAKVVADGGTISVTWGETAFTDLSWGVNYNWQIRAKDSAGSWSGWTQNTFFTNAAPGTPTNLTPGNSSVTSSRPKLQCKVTDVDDASLTVKARIKNNSGTVLQTRTMTLKVGTTDTYEYQTTSDDLASHATYRWDAYAYDGTLYSGEVTVEGDAAKSPEANFVYADGPTVTITSPTVEFTSASPSITWTAPGQVQRRVWLYLEGTNTVVYQSTLDVTASTSFDIPSGYVRNGITYDLVVEVVNSAPLTGYSDRLTVDTDFPAPDAIANFQASPEFQNYDAAPSSIRLTWEASEASDFVEYIISRRPAGTDDELIIARISSQATSTFTDFFPESGVEYTYALAQATIEGLDILVSDLVEAQSSAQLEHVVLCAVSDPGSQRLGLRLDADRGIDHVDDLVLEVPWGSNAPMPFYGTAQYQSFKGTFTLANDNTASAQDHVEALRNLWRSRQTICYRDERGRKFFGQIAKFSEKDRRVQFYTTDLTIIEVNRNEGVD